MATRQLTFEHTLEILAANANQADAEPHWPDDSWSALRGAGVLGWCIPAAYGGTGKSNIELLDGYEKLAGVCLTTTFILSQREAACRRLLDSDNESLRRELLPALAAGKQFATVGLSQLTTSRQHAKPTFVANSSDRGLVLEGTIPWVTGAALADFLVVGATLEDNRQILAVLPRGLPGVSIGPPLALMALEGSLTAEVHCARVPLDPKWLLAGPIEKVMVGRKGTTGGLETSCLALGLTSAAIAYLKSESVARSELRAITEKLEHNQNELRHDMHQLAETTATPEAAATLRGNANALVLRATQAALTASKGTGFLRNHPAQRWARQAMFFLVWSCPRPAAEATLAHLAPPQLFECP